MQIVSGGCRLALSAGDGGAARPGQPKAHADEQPAGFMPGGLDDVMPALFGPAGSARSGPSPELRGAVSAQHFNKCGVHIHGFLLSQDSLLQA
jgi:hypothetical protein